MIQNRLDGNKYHVLQAVCEPFRTTNLTENPISQLGSGLVQVQNDGDDIVMLKEIRTEDAGDWIAFSYFRVA